MLRHNSRQESRGFQFTKVPTSDFPASASCVEVGVNADQTPAATNDVASEEAAVAITRNYVFAQYAALFLSDLS